MCLSSNGHGFEGELSTDMLLTDPEEAADFVAKTKVDALAIAIGTSQRSERRPQRRQDNRSDSRRGPRNNGNRSRNNRGGQRGNRGSNNFRDRNRR